MPGSALPLLLLAFAPPAVPVEPGGAVADRPADEERLSFQTARPWAPGLNLNADVAMVYGIGDDPARTPGELAGPWVPAAPDDGRGLGRVRGLLLRRLRRRGPHRRSPARGRRRYDRPRPGQLLPLPDRGVRAVPDRGREAGPGRRGRRGPPGGAGILGPGRLLPGVQAGMGSVLRRAVGRPGLLPGRPVPGLEAQILSLPPPAGAGVRLRPRTTSGRPAGRSRVTSPRTR